MQRVVLEIIWGITDRFFKDANWTWGTRQLLEDVAINIAVPEPEQQEALDQWAKDTEKKKRLVTLICKINNQKIIEEKEMKDIQINVKDVKMLIEKMGINISVSFDNKGERK